MTPTETIRYLQDGGFFGARVMGGEETVFMHGSDVLVQLGEKERVISVDAFEAQFTGESFRKVQPTEQ